ncbi:MAG: putative aldehyde dehydrogenase [Marmoricola sp.]|nr:putative aldehyde dehydrogenase [Marmoricola sp.]
MCQEAADVARAYASMPRARRSGLLRRFAAALEGSRDEVLAAADRETALGMTRLNGELVRTCYQLRFLADVVEEGSFLEATIDSRMATAMGDRPELRRLMVPIGPVAVFGASNFPLAFSVPGGDTAAALAAGCPVLIKAHPAHPETSLAAFACLRSALSDEDLPPALAGLVHGREAGEALVRSPHVKAVAFTGSEAGGRALFDIASQRPDPIPFFGELGSLNPMVVSPDAAQDRLVEIMNGYVASMTLGGGQFCTKPGLLFVPEEHGAAAREALAQAIGSVDEQILLSEGIRDGFESGVRELAREPGVALVGSGVPTQGKGLVVQATVFATTVDQLTRQGTEVLKEHFGPASVVVEYADTAELLDALRQLPGTLAAALHAEELEEEFCTDVVELLASIAGRVVWNEYPTGVAVSWAMTHGGPYPSSTAAAHTSVGGASLRRFVRPVTFQSMPARLLPPELRDGVGFDVPIRIDGWIEA